MDAELIKYMHASRDLIYAVLFLNAMITIIVTIHAGFLLKKLFTAARDGDEPYDLVTNKKLDASNKAAQARTDAAVDAVTKAVDVRFDALTSEFRYQRKKMNMLLVIMRRIHDFMILKRMPATDLPFIEEDES
jgi:hypothetical protein